MKTKEILTMMCVAAIFNGTNIYAQEMTKEINLGY